MASQAKNCDYSLSVRQDLNYFNTHDNHCSSLYLLSETIPSLCILSCDTRRAHYVYTGMTVNTLLNANVTMK